MHRISLPADTHIWTYEKGITPIKEISELNDETFTVYSQFGKRSRVWSSPIGKEQLYLVHLDTGQQLAFGASHEFPCRSLDSPVLKTVCVADIADKPDIYLVPMPTRKMYVVPKQPRRGEIHDLLQGAFDQHEDRMPPGARSPVFLHIDSIDDMFNKALLAGFYGMAVRTKAAERVIELDEGRPSCFPTKLLFNDGVDDMVNTLIDKNVLRPAMPYNKFLYMVETTGCLFEAPGVTDLRTILGALSTTQEEETWTIYSDDPNTTIELPFIRT